MLSEAEEGCFDAELSTQVAAATAARQKAEITGRQRRCLANGQGSRSATASMRTRLKVMPDGCPHKVAPKRSRHRHRFAPRRTSGRRAFLALGNYERLCRMETAYEYRE
jgi:hypothetical protein